MPATLKGSAFTVVGYCSAPRARCSYFVNLALGGTKGLGLLGERAGAFGRRRASRYLRFDRLADRLPRVAVVPTQTPSSGESA